jgi:hypothetical protein
MIKPWLIAVSAPICGTDTYYCAYSEDDPLNYDDFPFDEITNYLWDNYSYLLHLDDEEYESEEEREEAQDQAYEDWKCDCNFSSEEMDLELDNPDDYETIYDERG